MRNNFFTQSVRTLSFVSMLIFSFLAEHSLFSHKVYAAPASKTVKSSVKKSRAAAPVKKAAPAKRTRSRATATRPTRSRATATRQTRSRATATRPTRSRATATRQTRSRATATRQTRLNTSRTARNTARQRGVEAKRAPTAQVKAPTPATRPASHQISTLAAITKHSIKQNLAATPVKAAVQTTSAQTSAVQTTAQTTQGMAPTATPIPAVTAKQISPETPVKAAVQTTSAQTSDVQTTAQATQEKHPQLHQLQLSLPNKFHQKFLRRQMYKQFQFKLQLFKQ